MNQNRVWEQVNRIFIPLIACLPLRRFNLEKNKEIILL